jgi:hypothetical protein
VGKTSQNGVKNEGVSLLSPKPLYILRGFVMTNCYGFGEVLESVREISLILKAKSGEMKAKSGAIP